MAISTPHDSFFKVVFQNKEAIKSLIKCFVSKEIVDTLDLDTLEVTSDSFIDKKLSKYFSDLVYKVRVKGDKKNNDVIYKYISLLFEHKYYITIHLPVQLLTYTSAAYYKMQKQKEPYRMVLPILFYHGESKYKKQTLKDIIPVPNEHFYDFLPNFDFIVINIRDLDAEQIQNLQVTGILRDALMLMRYVWNKMALLEHPEWFFTSYRQCIVSERKLCKIKNDSFCDFSTFFNLLILRYHQIKKNKKLIKNNSFYKI